MKQVATVLFVLTMLSCSRIEEFPIMPESVRGNSSGWVRVSGTYQSSMSDCVIKINSKQLGALMYQINQPDAFFYVNFVKGTTMPESVKYDLRIIGADTLIVSGTTELNQSKSYKVGVNW